MPMSAAVAAAAMEVSSPMMAAATVILVALRKERWHLRHRQVRSRKTGPCRGLGPLRTTSIGNQRTARAVRRLLDRVRFARLLVQAPAWLGLLTLLARRAAFLPLVPAETLVPADLATRRTPGHCGKHLLPQQTVSRK